MGTSWTSPTPHGHTPHVGAASATCATGDLLLCRALVRNAHMMLDLNPVLAMGIATSTVSGTFATKKRTLPAWTSVHVLVRRADVVHAIVCTHECISLVPLTTVVAAQSNSPLSRCAWRRLNAVVPPTDLATLHGLVDDLVPLLPLAWRDVSAPSLPPSVRAVVQRMCGLLRQSVVAIAPAEEDMLRYAFRNHDGDCLGWLFVEDVAKLAPEIEAMGIFKAGTSWVDELQALLARDGATANGESLRFTASDLVVAAKAVQRQHISAEYDVTLYASAALAAAFYEHARLLVPEQLLPSGAPKPLVPLAFSQAWQATAAPRPTDPPAANDTLTWLIPDLWSDHVLLQPA
ncbi:hypothetical protein SPRG_19226 [Saprolegnia parasitica CBS 223.65]|uniref:Uncharacterized protein n=1 Tax=Saprolegnia parasitica (strain CBS 223.65) TaxID=695850 RepID=A0A067CSB3_SAPPC|nr:hypothetical protein SPRG_19226 [Saprolegnia parasitica CBS 223.65]KDO33594.1 hypothetical protein SPRG_19226 [Saprolegnia parasitica CBS 223.65]|eukprot:XP_012195646.1 hypothetical protein SPRG_19226 [Saprolegnia parasitica CBS 223.65]